MHKTLFATGRKTLLAAAVCVGLLAACKKDHNDNPGGNPNPGNGSTALTPEDSLKYLMYQIMQVTYGDGGRNAATGLPTYYWYNMVPSLNPLDASKYPNADTLLAVMKRYTTNDRYSFLDRNGTLTNKVMNGISAQNFMATSGVTGDFGFEYAPALDQTGKLHLFILYADKNGPAGQIGVTRGWEITSVNGNSNFSNTNAFLQEVYNAIFQSSTVTLGFKRNDGSSMTSTLNAGSYNINPVAFDTVYNVGGKKTGYFVLYTYSSVLSSKGQPTFTKTALDQLFSKFTANGITNLIVDLRYNGGGAVTTAEYLDSAIAPASAAGKVMYNYKYNDKLTQNLAATGLDAQVKFPSPAGGLGLQHVFFITSRNTASASELTLNNLKPYMSVLLVGDTTYGKPVGFIDFNISMYDSTHAKKYLADLYAINFETQNANNQGGYYKGIAPDARAVDYVNVPWGNTTSDVNLRQVFTYLNTGIFSNVSTRMAATELTGAGQLEALPGTTPKNNFNGMVGRRVQMR
ncbi:S41 family peptidase [Chitinophaga vietnamensis]|uniref:S41 family peptidase n=1 Tax=Chitinophaga vietnamensis TaxID=2593957 RepID=UPI001177D436|nr:S41 family peptidase [Chitinophaga vietnamensis]